MAGRRALFGSSTPAELRWEDASAVPSYEGAERVLRFESRGPGGWFYRAEGYGREIADVLFWQVAAFSPDMNPQWTRRPLYLDVASGRALRTPTIKTHARSFDDAKRAAGLHAASVAAESARGPRSAEQIAAELTPDERRFVAEAVAEGGRVPEEFGTKSERGIRARQTRILRSLEPMGLFRGIALTPLGFEVARILEAAR